MRFPTQLWLACFLLVALAPGTHAFGVKLHEVQGDSSGTFTAADIDANGDKFSLVVPRGWRAAISEEQNSLSFSSKSGETRIAVTFSADNPKPLIANAESLRQSVAQLLNDPTVIEEFPAHAGCGSGLGVDLSFLLHGRSLRSRLAVIPLSAGHVSFILTCPPNDFAAGQQSFGATLTSFRRATQRPEAKPVKNGQNRQSSTRGSRNAEASVQAELPAPLRPELLVPLGALDEVRPSFLDGKRDYILLGLAILLVVALTTYTLVRHKREAEIRLLTGTYLSDGTEAAWVTMPAFFAEPVNAHVGLDLSKKDGETEKGAEVAVPGAPLAEFFKKAPEQLAQIRKLLPELSKAMDDAERKHVLLKMHEQIAALKTKADCWDLRPAWQLTSGLELLIKRLADKCKEVTPSTTRTMATAIDLLAEICVPGVRPDLIIHPPISVLAVDDDPLCLRAVMFALQKAEMTPDTAATGEAAVLLATEKSYDVVFMDIKMPGIDGLEACEQIRKLKKNENTPVVFVTVLSDFRTRAESTLAGGSDLLVKPFLMFEITVKVLIFTMRKRLGLAASLKREVAALTGASQLDGKATVALPPARPAPAAAPPVVDVPVNGVAGVVAAPRDEKPTEKPAYAGVELPALHMAPVALLDREVRVAEAAKKGDRKSRKWLKRHKAIPEAAAKSD